MLVQNGSDAALFGALAQPLPRHPAVPGAGGATLRTRPTLDAVEVPALRVHAAPIGIVRAAGTVRFLSSDARHRQHFMHEERHGVTFFERVQPNDPANPIQPPPFAALQPAELAHIFLPLRAVVRHALMMPLPPSPRPERSDTAASYINQRKSCAVPVSSALSPEASATFNLRPSPVFGLFLRSSSVSPFRRIFRTDRRCWFPCIQGNPRSR